MMQEFIVARVRQIEVEGNARRAALRNRSDAEKYRRDVTEKIQACFGGWPEKTPLNARVTGRLERDGYDVEHVVFESRPGFFVTANFYLPKNRTQRIPAVLGTCGHSDVGKAGPTYQSFAQGLARQGYAVFIFDPIGLGERFQYVGATPEAKPTKGPGVSEHLHAGNQQFLVGENFAAWNAWDGIRAMDYLLTRPEIDPRHIGVTGNSGGGTLATWLVALEPRLTMAAPSCFVTTLRRNAENELPVDTEQCPPRVLAAGLDHSDFYAAFAPRSLIVMGQEKDYFDARGLEEAGERLKSFYRLLGAEANVSRHIGASVHGYSQENREAMYRWFNQVTQVSRATAEPTLKLEEPKDLRCTPTGQVAGLPGGPRTVFSFTRDRSRELARQRRPLSGAALVNAVSAALHLPARTGTPDYRILRPVANRRYLKRHAATYVIETEPSAQAIVYRLNDEALVSRPPRDLPRAVLYVSHKSADAELRDDAWLGDLIRAESSSAIFACDVRGIGESRPNTCGVEPDHPYGNDYFYAVHGVMLDYSYPAQRTHDVLRVVDWLKANGHTEIHLVARGWGAIPATFAALLSPHITQVTLKQALTSFSAMAETEDYRWPLSSMVPGALRTFDLPDCYRALEAKRLVQSDPCDAGHAPA